MSVTATITEGELKRLTYAGHEYIYRVDRYDLWRDYYALIIIGGPYRVRAVTTCRKSSVKKNLMKIIQSLSHK